MCSLPNPHHLDKHPSLQGSEQPQTQAVLHPPKPQRLSSRPCAIQKRVRQTVGERLIYFSPFKQTPAVDKNVPLQQKQATA